MNNLFFRVFFILSIFILSCKSGENLKNSILGSSVNESEALDILFSKLDSLHLDSISNVYPKDHIGKLDTALWVYYKNNKADAELLWLGKGGFKDRLEQFKASLKTIEGDALLAKNYLTNSLLKEIEYCDSMYENGREISAARSLEIDNKISVAFLKLCSDMLFGMKRSHQFFNNKKWSAKNDDSLNVDNCFNILKETESIDSVLNVLRPKHAWYNKLRMYYTMLLNDKNHVLKPISAQSLSLIDSSADLNNFKSNLNILMQNDDSVKENNKDIVNILNAFKSKIGLNPDGKIDSATLHFVNTIQNSKELILTNLEKWKWFKQEFKGEHVFVNIPEYILRHYDTTGKEILKMNVVVGRVDRPSPTIDAKMTDVVVCPTWTMPPTIIKNDLLPSIQKRGGGAVTARGLKAYRGGKVVDPSQVNASNYKSFSYVQASSNHNALGTLKFNMPNGESVYLHDTNHRFGFENKVRANSSGCVRLQHPRDYAEIILGPQGYSRPTIDSMIKRNQTKSIKLDREITVHFCYLTINPENGLLVVPDVYKMDQVLAGLWN